MQAAAMLTIPTNKFQIYSQHIYQNHFKLNRNIVRIYRVVNIEYRYRWRYYRRHIYTIARYIGDTL